jgi:hypothetical protein
MKTPITGREKIMNQIKCWVRGKPVKILVENERVPAHQVWGSYSRGASKRIEEPDVEYIEV